MQKLSAENTKNTSKASSITPSEKLPANSVYRSAGGRAKYFEQYAKICAELPFPLTTKSVSTRFGETLLSTAGNPQNKPLIILPGMSISGPQMFDFCKQYVHERYLIAPDLIGHPGRSQDVQLPHTGNAYAKWLVDILDELKLARADTIATSFGASIALDLVNFDADRLEKLVLIVPAGLTPNIPYMRMSLKLFIPWLIYRNIPIRRLLPMLAWPLSRTFTQGNLDYLDIILRETAFWRHRPAGPFLKQHLCHYTKPVFLVQTQHDAFFPYKQTRKNAFESLNVKHHVFLEHSAHTPGEEQMRPVHAQILAFLQTD